MTIDKQKFYNYIVRELKKLTEHIVEELTFELTHKFVEFYEKREGRGNVSNLRKENKNKILRLRGENINLRKMSKTSKGKSTNKKVAN